MDIIRAFKAGNDLFGRGGSKAEPLRVLMSRKTRFKKKIRIDEKNLEWLRENKDCRTMAGFLDKIINNYKKESNDKNM